MTRVVDIDAARSAATNGARNGSSTSSGPAASTAEPTRQPAHRLPTGAYPVVGDGTSMRPRNEPQPEPADLFKPGPRAEHKPATERSDQRPSEATVKVAAVRQAMPQDATIVSPNPLMGRPDPRRS